MSGNQRREGHNPQLPQTKTRQPRNGCLFLALAWSFARGGHQGIAVAVEPVDRGAQHEDHADQGGGLRRAILALEAVFGFKF